jgi:beta-glucanase (GH16 family)
MKPTMLKSHDRLLFKFALIGVFSAFLAACGNQDTANPKSHDVYEPRITLNNPGADAIVETNSGTQHIPFEVICYVVGVNDCIDETDSNKNIVHYTKLDTEIDHVISIISDDFSDIDDVNFSPEGTQTTVVTVTDTVTYTALDFQSTTFQNLDISKKSSLHIDFYSDDITELELSIIDATGIEDKFSLTKLIDNGNWVNTDIPLGLFTKTDKSIINEIKIVGNGSLQFKNLYFHGQMVPQSIEGVITGYVEDHEFGKEYTDPGATARDVYDGHVDVIDSGSVGTELGSYTIKYTATDSSDNTGELNRVINVIDMEPPSITLNGDSAVIQGFFTDFEDPGASAVDNVPGDITLTKTFSQKINGELVAVTEISTRAPAEYLITYEFTDLAGNASTVERTIIVAPPEGEKITILKEGTLGSDWDSGIQAFDQDLAWGACTVPAGCPNIDWGFVEDDERGSVLEITHADTSAGAGVFISSSNSIDIRDARDDGFIKFDLKVTEGDRSIVFKADCGYPCGGGDQYVEVLEENKWQTVIVPVKSLIPNGPSGNVLDLETLKGGLVIQAEDAKATTFRIDNAYYDCRAATCAGINVPFVPVDWESTHEDPNDPEAFVAPTSYPGYTLAWSDEFDGDTVNTDNWGFDIGNGNNGWGNGELEYYREENASVEDGLLIIEAQKHVPPIDLPQKTGNRYTSSKLTSIDKVEFKYGRVDIRAVVAKGQGMWSAGWMLGANWSEIGWPYSGEIDIFDTIAGTKYGSPQEGMIVNNMYWNSTGPDPSEPLRAQGINDSGNAEYRINPSNVGETFSNRFHVFSLIWDENNIIFEVDGVNTGNDVALVGALAETYRNPFFLILNVAVGGAWPGPPDETTTFPDGMLVDYVRVYQTDSDGDGIADFELDGETPKDQN